MTTDQEKAFKELLELSKNLKDVNIEHLKKILTSSIKQIPVAMAILKEGWFIDRARLNSKEDLFSSKSDVSYIVDKDIIENHLAEYGRANFPHQVMFYGALESTKIKQNRATAIFEVSEVLKNASSICVEGELITISRWKILEDFLIAEVSFSDQAIANNPDTLRSFNHHISQAMTHPLRELMLRQMQFFSDEFAKVIISGNHWEYKISATYSDIIFNSHQLIGTPQIYGIAYPSVASGYQGQNIVLTPEAVDKFLQLDQVSTYRVHKNGLKCLINNHKFVNNIGEEKAEFAWEDMNSEDIVPMHEVNRHLGL